MKKNILIYGAGAIGRGYVPWLFDSKNYEISYVETNDHLRKLMSDQSSFTSFMTKKNEYKSKKFNFKKCFNLGEENPKEYDAIITAVGPRQVMTLVENFKDVVSPIVLFENDSSLAEKLKSITGKDNFFFGVPDVITSNTASNKKLDKDPLSIITEDGKCYVEDGAIDLGGNIDFVNNFFVSIAAMAFTNIPEEQESKKENLQT